MRGSRCGDFCIAWHNHNQLVHSRLVTKTILGGESRYTNHRRSNIYIGFFFPSSYVNLLYWTLTYFGSSNFKVKSISLNLKQLSFIILSTQSNLTIQTFLSLSFVLSCLGFRFQVQTKALKYTIYIPRTLNPTFQLEATCYDLRTLTRCKETEIENPLEPFQKVWAQRPLWVRAVEPSYQTKEGGLRGNAHESVVVCVYQSVQFPCTTSWEHEGQHKYLQFLPHVHAQRGVVFVCVC